MRIEDVTAPVKNMAGTAGGRPRKPLAVKLTLVRQSSVDMLCGKSCVSGASHKMLTAPLSTLNSPHPGVLHTMEFRGDVQHDENFNNIQKTKLESLAAAHILNNPRMCEGAVDTVAGELSKVVSQLIRSTDPIRRDFMQRLQASVSAQGQFGRIEKSQTALLDVLKAELTPVTLAQKMSIIKSVGAFVIDYAARHPQDYGFLNVDKDIGALIEKHRPPELFAVRGRSAATATESRDCLGILDPKQFKGLSAAEQNALQITDLNGTRPVFRMFTHELDSHGQRTVESAFVNSAFNADQPLVASISGSASCILVCADLFAPDRSEAQSKALALAAVGFLVGGGYHSATEVLAVAFPGLDLKRELAI